MIKIVNTGGGQARKVPEVRPTRPEHIPVYDELVQLTHSLETYRNYARSVTLARAKNWQKTANVAWAKAVGIRRELNKMYVRWRRTR